MQPSTLSTRSHLVKPIALVEVIFVNDQFDEESLAVDCHGLELAGLVCRLIVGRRADAPQKRELCISVGLVLASADVAHVKLDFLR